MGVQDVCNGHSLVDIQLILKACNGILSSPYVMWQIPVDMQSIMWSFAIDEHKVTHSIGACLPQPIANGGGMIGFHMYYGYMYHER